MGKSAEKLTKNDKVMNVFTCFGVSIVENGDNRPKRNWPHTATHTHFRYAWAVALVKKINQLLDTRFSRWARILQFTAHVFTRREEL